jgi:hypothetical protein
MPSPAVSRDDLASYQDKSSNGEEPLALSSLLVRLLLRLARGLGVEQYTPVPVRVYYKFDSGCWRSRNTQQLHKVYRCR